MWMELQNPIFSFWKVWAADSLVKWIKASWSSTVSRDASPLRLSKKVKTNISPGEREQSLVTNPGIDRIADGLMIFPIEATVICFRAGFYWGAPEMILWSHCPRAFNYLFMLSISFQAWWPRRRFWRRLRRWQSCVTKTSSASSASAFPKNRSGSSPNCLEMEICFLIWGTCPTKSGCRLKVTIKIK